MNFGLSGLDDLNGLDKALIEEIEKETKGGGSSSAADNKRKFDMYDEYELLLNKKKKKKKKYEQVERNTILTAKANFEQSTFRNSITGSPFNRTFQNHYIFNDYFFLREYVYKNNLTCDDIFFKSEQVKSKCKNECSKLVSTNKDINDYLKIYDCNDIFPPVYVKRFGCEGENQVGQKYMTSGSDDVEQQQGDASCMSNSFIRRNKQEFRKMLEKVVQEIKEEEEQKQEQKQQERIENEKTESGDIYQQEAGKHMKKQKCINFVEKYRAKYFSELLTDEAINREVLLWMKQWTERIAKGQTNMTPTHEHDQNEQDEARKNNEFQRILLLGGSAGKGKTTLAYVIANHFKFNIIEINGSDDRNKETLIPLVESIVCNNSIGSKPNICIIDEVDGLTSTQQNIEAIIKFLMKKDRRNKSIIRRPIICICNDIYHKSLKELRKISKVVVVDSVNHEMLKARISFICDKEGISIANEAVNKLVEICKGDIRAILNTICFLSIGGAATASGVTGGVTGMVGAPHAEAFPRTPKQKRKVVITMDLLNAYLFYKDANNNYMELLNMIYVKNKNKKIIKQLLQDCHEFFYLNMSNEYNYLQSYYYIYDNLMNVPFNDFDFCKLSYCLDFLTLCDTLEYKQKQNLNYSLQKMLFYAVYLFILILNLNMNSHVQYILMHNSHSHFHRTKQLSVKQIKENFLNENFGAITYKYIYSKHFFFEIINYIFSFFYMNEFFYRNVHLWGTASYFNDLDAPKYFLVPYHFNNVNKLKLFCLKLLHLMTLFNISFTNVSVSCSSTGSFHFAYPKANQPFRGSSSVAAATAAGAAQGPGGGANHMDSNPIDANPSGGAHASVSAVAAVGGGQPDKMYVFDPYVDDFLLYAEKKETGYRPLHQIGKPPMATPHVNAFHVNTFHSNTFHSNTFHSNTFHFNTLENFLNNTVCEKLNQLKQWINNQSLYFYKKKKESNQMHIIKSSSSKATNKGKFEISYTPNFEKSLTDIILIAQQKGYQNTFSFYFPNEVPQDGVGSTCTRIDAKTGSTGQQQKGVRKPGTNLKNEQNILKTKILHNTGDAALTIADLIREEKNYMDQNINKENNIYFTGKYVKTKGYYKNIEERCNAVLQPLHFCVFQGS
ncbi:hypothetical protein AK88_05022 [Plasmodium fragile]|uniref:ATPase AAA-type core domain-containing protein n=1 Tax=Plasmodium fragile TaxID=5857 RepID=A0A0D9QI13_PLAFR|nr:uncharacterized protein AK88_05022 [Plasmodium fragile]KJP85361.1 hypothetical protein AK88_05022 [Plasmodium fragile]